jgi:hypothetical protein
MQVGDLRAYLLYDAALVSAGGERVEVDDALDVGLDVAGRLEADAGPAKDNQIYRASIL